MKKLMFTMLTIVSVLMIGSSLYFMFLYEEKAPVKKVATNNNQAVAYVIIDINPSVELAVDASGTVVEALTLNEDADIAYNDLDVVGQSVADASKTVVDTAVSLGYIDELSDDNSVSVTTSTEDDALQTSLNTEVSVALNNHFTGKGLGVLILENGLDEELKTKADSYDIPYGKMLIIARAMQLDSTLVEADLVTMTIKDIQAKIRLQVKNRIEAKRQAMKDAKTSFKVLKEERKELAATKLKELQDTLFKEAEAEKGSPLTEEEKRTLLKEKRDEIRKEVAAAREKLKTARENRKQTINEIRQQYLNNRTATTTTQTSTM